MLRIGLTGGIGSGKSTVSTLLAQRGFRIIDADLIARQIVEPGRPALIDLVAAFGPGILHPDGTLNRAQLAALAFATPEATAELNAITHPRIQEETARQFAEAEAEGEKAVIHDIPLLVEMGYAPECDLVVVVDVDMETRIQRLIGRGVGAEDARRRIAAQIPDSERLAVADVVINNGGSLADLPPQVDALVKRIHEME